MWAWETFQFACQLANWDSDNNSLLWEFLGLSIKCTVEEKSLFKFFKQTPHRIILIDKYSICSLYMYYISISCVWIFSDVNLGE